nr:MAG TPA_asm: hypothetical protein [Caudoviricetes sp.]
MGGDSFAVEPEQDAVALFDGLLAGNSGDAGRVPVDKELEFALAQGVGASGKIGDVSRDKVPRFGSCNHIFIGLLFYFGIYDFLPATDLLVDRLFLPPCLTGIHETLIAVLGTEIDLSQAGDAFHGREIGLRPPFFDTLEIFRFGNYIVVITVQAMKLDGIISRSIFSAIRVSPNAAFDLKRATRTTAPRVVRGDGYSFQFYLTPLAAFAAIAGFSLLQCAAVTIVSERVVVVGADPSADFYFRGTAFCAFDNRFQLLSGHQFCCLSFVPEINLLFIGKGMPEGVAGVCEARGGCCLSVFSRSWLQGFLFAVIVYHFALNVRGQSGIPGRKVTFAGVPLIDPWLHIDLMTFLLVPENHAEFVVLVELAESLQVVGDFRQQFWGRARS